jgi:hypothetical protein
MPKRLASTAQPVTRLAIALTVIVPLATLSLIYGPGPGMILG